MYFVLCIIATHCHHWKERTNNYVRSKVVEYSFINFIFHFLLSAFSFFYFVITVRTMFARTLATISPLQMIFFSKYPITFFVDVIIFFLNKLFFGRAIFLSFPIGVSTLNKILMFFLILFLANN